MNPHDPLKPGLLSFEMAESAATLEDVARNVVAAALVLRDGAFWKTATPAYHTLGTPFGSEILKAAAWIDQSSGWIATFHRNADFEYGLTLEDRHERPNLTWTVGIAAVRSIPDLDPAFGVVAAAQAIDAVWSRFVESGRDESESAVARWGNAVTAMIAEDIGIEVRGVEFPSPYDEVPRLRVVDIDGLDVEHPLLDRLAGVVPTSLHVTARDRRVTFGRTFDPQEPSWPIDALGVLRTVAEIKTRLAKSEDGA